MAAYNLDSIYYLKYLFLQTSFLKLHEDKVFNWTLVIRYIDPVINPLILKENISIQSFWNLSLLWLISCCFWNLFRKRKILSWHTQRNSNEESHCFRLFGYWPCGYINTCLSDYRKQKFYGSKSESKLEIVVYCLKS